MRCRTNGQVFKLTTTLALNSLLDPNTIPTQPAQLKLHQFKNIIKEPSVISKPTKFSRALAARMPVRTRTRAKSGKVMCRKLGYHLWNFLMFTLSSDTEKNKVL